MDLELDGDAALVTASSSGLGKATATALAREGADVLLNGRDDDRLAAAVADVGAAAAPGATVAGHAADISRAGEVAGLVDRAADEFGGLDHLVTSAGGPPPLRPLEPDEADWRAAFDLLVMSVVRAVDAAAPLLSDGGGTITAITSRVVKEASPGNVLSSAVRMPVVGLTGTLSRELAPEVRANAILPGLHDTPRLDSFDAAGLDARTDDLPLGRLGDPMELGDTIAFLASPRAGYVTGETIAIDGGSLASTL